MTSQIETERKSVIKTTTSTVLEEILNWEKRKQVLTQIDANARFQIALRNERKK